MKGKGTFVGGLGGNEIGIIVGGGAESSSSPSSGDSEVSGRLASLSSGDLEACRFRGVKTMPRQVQSHDSGSVKTLVATQRHV